MTTALLVVLALLGIQVAVLAPILVIWRRRAAASMQDLDAQVRSSGETIVAGPERAVYRGGTGSDSRVKGNGALILTDRRLVFRKVSGGVVEVPRSRITGVSRSHGFRQWSAAAQTHLVVSTTDPAEVAFLVNNPDPWELALG